MIRALSEHRRREHHDLPKMFHLDGVGAVRPPQEDLRRFCLDGAEAVGAVDDGSPSIWGRLPWLMDQRCRRKPEPRETQTTNRVLRESQSDCCPQA